MTTILPAGAQARKNLPITSGVLKYFPKAIAYVAYVSKIGNDQHNPGEPMHWAKEKSTGHADCIPRHLIESGTFDDDNVLHDGKLAWRALANLEVIIEQLEAQGIDVLAGNTFPCPAAQEPLYWSQSPI